MCFILQGYLLQGISYQNMNMFKLSLASMLAALDVEGSNGEKVTNHIAATVSQSCQISPSLAITLKGKY